MANLMIDPANTASHQLKNGAAGKCDSAPEFRIVPRAAIDSERWDGLVNDSAEGWLYQTSFWIDYGQSLGSIDHSFGVVGHKGDLLAILPLFEVGYRRLRYLHFRQLSTGMGGPAWASMLSRRQRRQVSCALAEEVDRIAARIHADSLDAQTTMTAPAYLPEQCPRLNPLHELGWYGQPRRNIPDLPAKLVNLVNLSGSEAAILQQFAEAARQRIRYSQSRHSCQARAMNSTHDLATFARLQERNWVRTGMIPHQISIYEGLWRRFWPKALFGILVEREQRAIAAGLFLVYKMSAYYYAGGWENKPEAQGAMAYLMWEAMREARRRGCRWFDVGISYSHPDIGQKEFNVGRFKENFHGIQLPLFLGQKVYRPKRWLAIEFLSIMCGRGYSRLK